MKHNTKFLSIVLFSFLLITVLTSGCKKFLEQDNRSSYTEENYFQTGDQAQSFVNNLYARLRFITDGAGTYGESPFMLLEFPTGLVNTEVGQSLFNNNLRNLTENADNSYFFNWWQNCYNIIGNANLALERIPNVAMDATVKKRLLGEASFFRAFAYYHLVRLFGDVPLITTSIDLSSPDLYPVRSSQESVYSLIVSDLQAAETAGLPIVDNTGRVTVGAAKTLLASVYLTMAGYPMQKTANYPLAASKALEVISSGTYSLFPTYDDLRNKTNKNRGEFIFQNQYLVGSFTSGVMQYFLPRARRITRFSDEIGSLYPTPEFYASFTGGDLRAQERQYFFSSYPSINGGSTVNFGGQFVYKFFDTEAATTAQSDQNWTFLRYPEVLLIYAEASNEAAGPSTQAYSAVNQIRKRAKLPDLSGLSQAQFRQAVWTERYHELCFENKAWFDMQRTRQAYNPVNGTFDNFVGHKFTYGPTLSDKYLLFAIPSREINNNKKLTQNPGW